METGMNVIEKLRARADEAREIVRAKKMADLIPDGATPSQGTIDQILDRAMWHHETNRWFDPLKEPAIALEQMERRIKDLRTQVFDLERTLEIETAGVLLCRRALSKLLEGKPPVRVEVDGVDLDDPDIVAVEIFHFKNEHGDMALDMRAITKRDDGLA